MSFRLRRRESVEVALRRIALEQIDAMLAQADEGDPHAGTAHAIRKRCKKTRGLLRLVRGSFGAYRDEQRALRDVARLLAPAREAKVRLATIDRWCDPDGGIGPEDAAALRDWLEAHCTGRLDTIAFDEALVQARALLQAQRGRVAGWTLEDLGFDAVRDGLALTYRRGRDAAREAADLPTPECLHELRKRVKYHRFHLALLRDAWRAPLAAAADEARALGDVLGEHHDAFVLLETLRDRLDDGEIGAAAARALPVLEARMRELERRAHPLAARLFAEKPRAFERRMRGYWRTWRRTGAP